MEIGQIYEALLETNSDHPLLKHNMSKLAANILLDGYPFEIFDGYVNAVPNKWVPAVLNELHNILNNRHNTQGRIKLIKVEETYSEELGIDYVLAIDTEGLRAPELTASGQMIKHDSELSTFVIGLGNLTILNPMGENTTYLDDLLPISVHTFLRMEEIKLKPKCIIVHQNVNKEDNQKLLQQGRKLEEYLDKTTEMVCTAEDTDIKSFKEIIEFDVSKDAYYLPALLEGSPPMAPISTRYSDEINILKQSLLKKETDLKQSLVKKESDLEQSYVKKENDLEQSLVKKETDKGQSLVKAENDTLISFSNLLQNLWSAIKRDDFVYQFRNTIETEARIKLDKYWCEANWKFRQQCKGYTRIQNTHNVNELDSLIKSLENEVKEKVEREHSKQKDAFDTFITKSDTLMKETMMKWSVDMDKRFDDLRTEFIEDTTKKLKELQQCMREKFSLKNDKLRYKDTLKGNIADLVRKVTSKKCGNLTKDKILDLFEKYWKGWKLEILKDSPTRPICINIGSDALIALERAFPSNIAQLKAFISVKTLACYDFDDFKSQTLLSGFQTLKKLFGFQKEELLKETEHFVTALFERVKAKLESRKEYSRPYSKEDMEEVVDNINDYFSKNKKPNLLKPKDEVHLTVMAFGHAIKELQILQKKYEKDNSLENLMEKEKNHYHRIFSALCDEAEIVNLLGIECQEILKKGILHKMTHTLYDKIQIDLRSKPFTVISKTVVIYDHMIKMAKYQLRQEEKPIEQNFDFTLKTIKAELKQALQRNFACRNADFNTWLQRFRRETKDLIVLENIDRLDELGKEKEFDLDLFFKTILQCLTPVIEEIKEERSSHLTRNYESMKDKVTKSILKKIIGCTEGCPFCGAICMVADEGHTEEHYTTLHRPKGCKGRNYEDSKILVTNTCPQAISIEEKFCHYENGAFTWYSYNDYKSVYPRWNINADETGDETSFWNWFFAMYADNIAGENLKVPEIPFSWKELDRETEIKKLEANKNR
ncbi:hypothetical protein CHS0354_027292 [Potamilus streckersoni]|uniref:VLIG-type G domain-containing protein n=1 Tax=Potamilus streckersoni TaxID=2493646 RepID=A0AAE0W9P6_9BIVA|nr:hypothetical protein CHS0354_027292 [Potamilus streckersoni]